MLTKAVFKTSVSLTYIVKCKIKGGLIGFCSETAFWKYFWLTHLRTFFA